MKKFLFNIIIGLLAFCVIWALAEIFVANTSEVNSYSYKYKYVMNNTSIQTLLIGNSYFENSINPYMMGDSVFDFAISGRWIYYDVQLLSAIVPTMPNVKVVIFPMGYKAPYISWHYYGLRPIDRDYAYKYSKYMHIYYDRYPESLRLRSALFCNKMRLQYRKEEPQDSLGYDPGIGQVEDWSTQQNISPSIIEGDTAYLCYQEYRTYLIELARICHENNIRFIVVTTPCADSFIANTREQGVRNLYDLIDSVSVYYPVEYYNIWKTVSFAPIPCIITARILMQMEQTNLHLDWCAT